MNEHNVKNAFVRNEQMIIEAARKTGVLDEEDYAFEIKFHKGERVYIKDGFAHIGSLATIEDVSRDWSGIISYKLKEFAGWWPQSSLETTKL